jgi:hypothetical protein
VNLIDTSASLRLGALGADDLGQRLEQLEQLGRRRVRGQGDFPDAMKVQTLH